MAAALGTRSSLCLKQQAVIGPPGKEIASGPLYSTPLLGKRLKAFHFGFRGPLPGRSWRQSCLTATLSLPFFRPLSIAPRLSHWSRELCLQSPSHRIQFSHRTRAGGDSELQLEEDKTPREDDSKVSKKASSSSEPEIPDSLEKFLSIASGVFAFAIVFVAFNLVPWRGLIHQAKAGTIDPPRSVTTVPSKTPAPRLTFNQQARRHKKGWSGDKSKEPQPESSSPPEGGESQPIGQPPAKEELEGAIRARVPYSFFLDAAEAGLVRAVWIMNHWAVVLLEEGTVEYKPPEGSWLEKMITKDLGPEKNRPTDLVTTRLPDNDTTTVPALRKAGIQFEVIQGQPGWQDQLANLGQYMWWALMATMLFTMVGSGELGGLAGMMNKKAKLFQGGKSDTSFEDVAGCDEAKEELVEVVGFLKNSEKYRALGARVPKGVLLCGPAGTGKTLLAKAVAGEADVPFFSISASEFVEIYGGMGASRVRKTFADCRKKAPCILFIDELDAIGRSRSEAQVAGYDQEREQTLNQMLTEMDGFDSTKDKPVIILGATNRPEVLDTALLRPGRFDRTVTVDRPDKKGREAILRLHLKDIKFDKDLDVTSIAGSTIGFTGADLANVVNEAALLAARKDLEQVGREQLMEAAERSRAGLERKSLQVSDIERRTVAFHECGHAVVGSMSPEVVRSTVTKISIVPRGSGALGYTLNEPQEDRYLQGEDDIRSFITVALAGRAAEKLVFGRLTSGAADDLQRATESAERMVTMFGMSSKVGPRALRSLRQSHLEEQGYVTSARQGGPELQKVVDDEITGILQAADDWCQRILVRNRGLLDEMAEKLLVEEVLQENQLADFLKRAVAPEGLEDWFKTGSLSEG